MTERGFRALAEPRPVLRGLRQEPGDCPYRSGRQSCRAETRSQGIATPQTFAGCKRVVTIPLAEPRPVLRGLRRGYPVWQHRTRGSEPCRAETRSQGIATTFHTLGYLRKLRPCRAETRSQGIATLENGGPPTPRISSCRAETRSQGIATRSEREGKGRPSGKLAEPRPVLRGLRRRGGPSAPPPGRRRLAEPRPVLRGLRRLSRSFRSAGRKSQLAEPRPVLRGLRRQYRQ